MDNYSLEQLVNVLKLSLDTIMDSYGTKDDLTEQRRKQIAQSLKEVLAIRKYESLCTSAINDFLEVLEQLKTETHVNPIANRVESILCKHKRHMDAIDYLWTHNEDSNNAD